MITIAYINYWNNIGDPQDRWFTNFIKENINSDVKEVLWSDDPDILISSCFTGMKGLEKVNKSNASIKIFFSGENLYRYPPYDDIELLNNTFDLNLLFKYDNFENKIVRFPFWLLYYPFYKMDKDSDNIIDYLENIHLKNTHKEKNIFGTLLSRHDRSGHKTVFLKELEKYGNVLCPSKYNTNCPDIGKGNHNKINFVSKSKYNICPENSEFEGYYTEKVFEALQCGSVPIYWAISEPEPGLLCKNKYCFIKNKDDPIEVSHKIKDVIDNYDSYTQGKIFLPDAPAIIHNYYETLKTQIIKLLVLKTNKTIVTPPPNYIFDFKDTYTLNNKDNTTPFVHDKHFHFDKECLKALRLNHRPVYRDICQKYLRNDTLFDMDDCGNECIILNNSYANDKGWIITDNKIYTNIGHKPPLTFNSKYQKENSVVSILSPWLFKYDALCSLMTIPKEILSKSKIHVSKITTEIMGWVEFLNIPPKQLITGDIYAETLYIPKMSSPGNPYYYQLKWLKNLVFKDYPKLNYVILVKCKNILNFNELKDMLNTYCKYNNFKLYVHDLEHLSTLRYQLEMFGKAKIVFTSQNTGNHLISMNSNTWYVEFISNKNINICYSRIAYFNNINFIGSSMENHIVNLAKVKDILENSIKDDTFITQSSAYDLKKINSEPNYDNNLNELDHNKNI